MKYRVTDLQKSLFEEAPVIEAKSPKVAAKKVTGCKVKRNEFGNIVVNSTSSPFRSYVYKRIEE